MAKMRLRRLDRYGLLVGAFLAAVLALYTWWGVALLGLIFLMVIIDLERSNR